MTNVAVENGYYVVMATHPMQPNWDNSSRSRSHHLVLEKKTAKAYRSEKTKTLCNMQVVNTVPEFLWHGSGCCITCFTKAGIKLGGQ